MKIKNPTNNEISIQHKGDVYTVGGNDSISNVPSAAAEYWKTMIHSFIVVEEDGVEIETKVGGSTTPEVPVEVNSEPARPVTKRTRK